MRALCVIVILLSTVGSGGEGWAEDALGMRPLLTIARKDLPTILPPDCHILIDPRSILARLKNFSMHWMGARRIGI